MKIKILKTVALKLEQDDKTRLYEKGNEHDISEDYAKENDLYARYSKFPQHIEILEQEETNQELKKLSKEELKELALEKGIELPEKIKKEEIIKLIEE